MSQASVLSVLALLLVSCAPTSPAPEPEPFRSVSSQGNTAQTMESILHSIEERLRNLDNVYSLRFAAPRWELSVETQSRKLEALESKLSRVETLLELRMDKITETLTSKSLKEEFMKDQLNRKIDTIYERLNHRMSYMETRIENNINKMQSSIDATLTRMSGELESLEKSTGELETDVMEVSSGLDEVKTSLMVNGTLLDTLERQLLKEWKGFQEKVTERQKDLLEKMKGTEESLSLTLEAVNRTNKDILEGFQSLRNNRKPVCQAMPDETVDFLLDKVDSLIRKNDVNYQKLDMTVFRLMENQDGFKESCLRLQMNEPQIETRIGDILEKILDSIDNRSNSTNKNYEILMEGLKSHHGQVVRTIQATINNIIKLQEVVSEELRGLGKEMNTGHTTDKIDIIINSLQDLQETFMELNVTLTTTQINTQNILHSPMLSQGGNITTMMQTLNENINTMLDTLTEYYKTYDMESGEGKHGETASKKILGIFNMTEDDLNSNHSNAASVVDLD